MLERLDWTTITTAIGAILVAIVSGFFSWHAGAKKAGVEAQNAITEGFKVLVGELQEERQQLIGEIKEQQKEITELRKETRDLQDRVTRLSAHIVLLEGALTKAGHDVPAPPNRAF